MGCTDGYEAIKNWGSPSRGLVTAKASHLSFFRRTRGTSVVRQAEPSQAAAPGLVEFHCFSLARAIRPDKSALSVFQWRLGEWIGPE